MERTALEGTALIRAISAVTARVFGSHRLTGPPRGRSRILLAAPPLVLAVALAGCGSSHSSTTSKKSASSTPKSAVAALTVKTAKVTVSGTSETVFTNAAGRTLYYFTPDTPTKIACTAQTRLPNGDACTAVWPPLTTSASTVNAPSGVSGTFTVYKGANGNQVEYNGHPLYTFSGDTGPDQSHGEGLLGKWFVATPSLAPAATSASPSPSSSSGGYSY